MLSHGLDNFGRVVAERIGSMTRKTSYDAMGQVVVCGREHFQWDEWGRLIAIKGDNYEWTASYDALGRRLQTNYTPINKGRFWDSKGKTVVTTSFYDPEQQFQEIGVTVGKKSFWKIYRSFCCDAVVDASGDVAVLQYDMKNNLVAAVNTQSTHWSKDYPTPYGPRAPPSSESPDLISYALSLKWQGKRTDPTGFIWFGARYYDPQGGRFLSPDPVCYPVCLDLYAYANGDPINNFDPDGRFASAVYDPRTSYSDYIIRKEFNSLYGVSEFVFPSSPSTLYDLSDLGRPELPNGQLISYLNGMGTTYKEARENAIHISDLCEGYNVHGVYGGTKRLYGDAITCLLGHFGVDTGNVKLVHETWDNHFNKYPDGRILHYCNSRGCIETNIALSRYSEARRMQIDVVGIAPGGYVDMKTCGKVSHYRATTSRDLVPLFDFLGAIREKDNIIVLPSDPEASLHDHSLKSPTFVESIETSYKTFRTNKVIK